MFAKKKSLLHDDDMEDSDEGETKGDTSDEPMLNSKVLNDLLRFGGSIIGKDVSIDTLLMTDNPDFLAHFLRINPPHKLSEKLLKKIQDRELLKLVETPVSETLRIKGYWKKTIITRKTTAWTVSENWKGQVSKDLKTLPMCISWENAGFVFDVYKELLNVLAANEFVRESTIHTPRTLYYYSVTGGNATTLSLSDLALYERIIWVTHLRTKNQEKFDKTKAKQDDDFYTHPATVILGCTELNLAMETVNNSEEIDEEKFEPLLYTTTWAMAAPLYITDDAEGMLANKGYDKYSNFKNYVIDACKEFVPEMISAICPTAKLASETTPSDSHIPPSVAVIMTDSWVNHFIPLLFGLACSLGGSLYINELMKKENVIRFVSEAKKIYRALSDETEPGSKWWIQCLIEWILVFRTPFFVSFFEDDKALDAHPARLSSVKMEELLKSMKPTE